MAEPLTEEQVTRMAWKGLLYDARSNPENPEEEHAPLGDDEAYVTSLVSDCSRWAYYSEKLGTKGRMNFTSVFKTSLGTLVHRAKFFDKVLMEQRVNFGGVRGRLDAYDSERNIIYEVKTTENDKLKYPKPNEHHIAQVLIYWALLYKMKGIIAKQAFILYVVFPRQRLIAFEVKLPIKKGQRAEEVLDEIWENTLSKKNLLCACRKASIPPEPNWGTWNSDYCDFNEQCILDSPYFEKHCLAGVVERDAQEME